MEGKKNEIDLSKVAVSMDDIELEDREFIAAIREIWLPNASLAQVLPCMHTLGGIEEIIDPPRGTRVEAYFTFDRITILRFHDEAGGVRRS